jgi:hypothetical protein
VPGLERSVQGFLGCHRAGGAVHPHAARLASAGAHVLGERGQLGEVLLDAIADEGAGPLLADQQAVFDQLVDGLAHRDARDLEHLGEIALGWQRIVGPMTRLSMAPRSARCSC